jgi:type I restriction enzyme S subunit
MIGPVWEQVRLGSILRYLDERVELDDEKEYLTITVKRRHGGLEIREKLFGHQIVTKKQFRLIPGAFIISRVQCWHQAYAIVGDVPRNAIASTNYDQFAISPEVDPRFFWWLSHSPEFTETVRSSAVGVVIEKMVFDREEWLRKSIRLPPLAEQRRVVEQVEELAAQVREAQTLRHRAAEEAKALVASSVSTLCFDGYPIRPFGELLTEAKNGIYKPPDFWGQGQPCIRMYNIDGPELNQTNLQLLDVTAEELKTYGCVPGDLVFNRVNSAELVGKTGIIRPEFPRATFESKNMRLRVDQRRAVPEFVAHVLNSPTVRAYYRKVLKQQCGMATLNQGHVRNIPFPDVELSEQRRIVSELDALQGEVNALKCLQAETAAELDALVPSILSKAFAGEL